MLGRSPDLSGLPDRQAGGVTSNYGYDAIYELLSTTQGSNTTESYTYDPVGNRLSSLGVSSYSYNASNELTSTSAASYAYDYNGNTTSKTVSGNTTNYTWDYENRLTSVTLPGTGGSVAFEYDPFGRRIQKTFTQNSATTTTNYVYDGADSIEETDQNGNLLGKYARTTNIDEPLAESRSGVTSYFEADGLGSVTSLSSTAGALANTYTYDSFGNTTNSTGSITNPFRYTGREFDSETGLYYYRARYYDTSVGRFISEDRIGFRAGTNFYAYVFGNPVLASDPTGLDVQVGLNLNLTLFLLTLGGGGGGTLGISSDGTFCGTSFFLSEQANGMVGAGLYGGVGLSPSFGHTNGPLTNSTGNWSLYGEADVGWGPAVGVSGSAPINPNGTIGWTGSNVTAGVHPRFPGFGAGAALGVGASYSSTQVWDLGRALCGLVNNRCKEK